MEQRKETSQQKKPMDVKKMLIIAAVTVGVIIVAILIDNMIRNPRVEDETAALNVVIAKVLPSLDEIADDEGFAMFVQELEHIGNDNYYPVYITRIPKCEDGEGAKRVVEKRILPGIASGGQIDLTLLPEVTIEDFPYYVVEASQTNEGQKTVLGTYHVRKKNSQPFRLEADGTLTPLADEEELPVTTIYVMIKNSQVFQKDNTTGQLIPYGG